MIGTCVPAGGGAPAYSERFAVPRSWGSVTRNTSTVLVGTGTRIDVARRIALDLSVSRFESRKLAWAIDPQICIDYNEAPLILRRRTALLV